MLINYDPDGKPNLSNEMLEEAERCRLHPVNVICDEPNACVGDASGISFIALVSFIPREGDRINLEDGRACEVKRIFHKVVAIKNSEGQAKSILLMPNVYAYLVHDEKGQ